MDYTDDRAVFIKLRGTEYPMLHSIASLKAVCRKFGGIAELGKALNTSDFAGQLDVYSWALTLLINQAILLHNIENPESKKELLTEEHVELLMTFDGLAEYSKAITNTLFKGMMRNVKSEDSAEGEEGEDGEEDEAKNPAAG